MNTVTPVTFTTPDGVERTLRWTLGARTRIKERFHCDLVEALQKHGDGAAADLLWCCLYDKEGKPPADITLVELRESLPGDACVDVMAVVMSAATQGKASPNEVEALIRAQMKEAAAESQTSSISGASELSASDSPTNSSGTDISSAKSSPDTSDGESSNLSAITAAA